MELPESGCAGKYGLVEAHEELTLTPHHTPSQSFDFIVWDKAYLDSIPAGEPAASSSSTTVGTSKATIGAPTEEDFNAEASTTQGSAHLLSCGAHSTDDADFKVELGAEPRLRPLVHSSSENDAALMACRTDADLLPSCSFGCKARLCDDGSCLAACVCEKEYIMPRRTAAPMQGLTSLEEAVTSYVEGRQRRSAVPPSPGCRRRQASWSTLDNYKQLTGNMGGDYEAQDYVINGCLRPGMTDANIHTSQHDSAAHRVNNMCKPARAHDHSSSNVKVFNEALLKRSVSQPGGSKGWNMASCEVDAGVDHVFDMKSSATLLKPTSKQNSAGHVVGIYRDQCNAGQPQDGTKVPCFPASRIGLSPGRRKQTRATLDDRELSDIAGKHGSRALNPTLDMLHKGKPMSPAYTPTLYIHQQQDKLSPATWADLIDVPVGCASTSTSPRRCLAPMQQHVAGCYRSSFSDVSSLSSNDHHVIAPVMSKLRLWGLHHKIKALCRKFCYSCPNVSHSSSMSSDFKR